MAQHDPATPAPTFPPVALGAGRIGQEHTKKLLVPAAVRGTFAQVSAALALIGIVLGASPAMAGPGAAVRIDFEAPSGCSDAQAFTDALAERSQSLRLAK